MTPPTATAAITLAALLLASKMAPQITSDSFVSIKKVVKGLMTNGNPCTHPLWAQSSFDEPLSRKPIGWIDRAGVTAVDSPFLRQKTGLPRAAAPRIASNLSTVGRLMSPEVQGNLGLGQTLFQQGGNLVAFFCAEMVIGRRVCSTTRSRETESLPQSQQPQHASASCTSKLNPRGISACTSF